HEPGGEGRHCKIHSRHQLRMGHDHHPDRARYGRRDGHLASRGRTRQRPQHRGGDSAPGAEQSGRDPGLSGRRQSSVGRSRINDHPTRPCRPRRKAEPRSARPAIREKHRGIWQSVTWAQYFDEVRALALGLAAFGFKRGEHLSVIGDNRPPLYWAQYAAQCLGGVAVPVYQDAIATELVYVLEHAEVSVIVVEDQEQADKILSLKDKLPHLRLLIYDDPLGMRQYQYPFLKSLEEIQAAGRNFGAKNPDFVEREIDAGAEDD